MEGQELFCCCLKFVIAIQGLSKNAIKRGMLSLSKEGFKRSYINF